MPYTHHQHHFEDLSPDDFERLIYWLVERSGEFDQVQWYGGARDKGRDVVAYRHTAGAREKWYIQAKRFQSIAFPTLRDELDKLAQHAAQTPEFAPDIIVFATACPVPPDSKDKADAHARDLSLPEPYYWGRLELDEKLKFQPDAEREFFGTTQPSRPAPYQPPRPLPEFVGRTDELQRLADLLQPGTRAAITGLVGMGGLGKTELAKLAAHRAADRFRDGVLWADCGHQDLTTIADLWAAAYGVQLPGDDAAAKAAAWRSLVSGKEALLIFDNVQPSKDVEPLFPPRGRSAVLITTRHTGHPALRSAERLVLDQFTPAEAAALAEQILGVKVARAQTDDATRLFELLGYLPLAVSVALHLAAKCAWNLAYLIDKLQAAGALTILGDEGSLTVNLNATFDTAWANLPADLQQTFRTLALFNEGSSFSTEALADTLDLQAPEAQAQLRRLAGRSLLADVGEGRWSLHPLLREFAATRPLVDQTPHARVARHYVSVANAASDLYLEGGKGVLQGLALFDLEWPHIRAGQAWAAAHAEEDEEAAHLCNDYPTASLYCLDLRLYPHEQIRWLDAAARAARRLGDRKAEGWHRGNLGNAYEQLGDTRKAIECYEQILVIAREIGDWHGTEKTLGNLGIAHARLGETREAITYLERYLTIAREIGDWHGTEKTLGNLGITLALLGETRKAIAYFEQALAMAREIGDRHDEGAHLHSLGNAYSDLGDARRATQFYKQALVIAQEIGDRRGEGNALNNLGNAYEHLGETRKAIEYHEQALAISQEIGNRRGEGNALGNLGTAYTQLGETRKAIAYHERALAISQEIGNRHGEGTDLGNLGLAYAHLGKMRKAIAYHEGALAIAQEIGDRRGEGNHLGNLGNAYMRLGETRKTIPYYEQAIPYYEQALAIDQEIGDRRGEGNALGNLGNAYLRLRETHKAIAYYEQALAIAREIGDRRGEAYSLGNLGEAYADLGEARRAIEYYRQALAISQEIGDRRGEGADLGNLGNAYAVLGETSRATEYYKAALALFEAIEDPRADQVRGWLAELED